MYAKAVQHMCLHMYIPDCFPFEEESSLRVSGRSGKSSYLRAARQLSQGGGVCVDGQRQVHPTLGLRISGLCSESLLEEMQHTSSVLLL